MANRLELLKEYCLIIQEELDKFSPEYESNRRLPYYKSYAKIKDKRDELAGWIEELTNTGRY